MDRKNDLDSDSPPSEINIGALSGRSKLKIMAAVRLAKGQEASRHLRHGRLMRNLAEQFEPFRPNHPRSARPFAQSASIQSVIQASIGSPKNNPEKFRSHVDSATPRSTYQQRASK
jgi:hypothetical protein